MSDVARTPEFLCWAIERQCPLREMLPENQPEKVERHLRAARFTAEARGAGRVQDDLAVSGDRTMGFCISEALTIYGGEAAVRQCCLGCPANALANMQQPSYAGCYGLLPLPEPADVFLERMQQFGSDLFPPTRRRWYSWWLQSPLNERQVDFLAEVFTAIRCEPPLCDNQELKEFTAALVQCVGKQLPLSVQLYPAGTIAGVWWNLDPHCPVCRAPWQADRGCCAECQQSRHPASPKKRRVRGSRPYRALQDFGKTARD